jgi:hypothetical protein
MSNLYPSRVNAIATMNSRSADFASIGGRFVEGLAPNTILYAMDVYGPERLFEKTVALRESGYSIVRAASVGQLEHTRTVGSVVCHDLVSGHAELARFFAEGAIVAPFITMEDHAYTFLPGVSLLAPSQQDFA